MFIKNSIHGILIASSKKPLTNGTTKKAFGESPYFCVKELIFARAFGVAPIPCPIKPLIMMAESKSFPSTLKQINIENRIIKITWKVTIKRIGGNNVDNSNKSIFISDKVKKIPNESSFKKSISLKFNSSIFILSFKFLKITAENIQVTTEGNSILNVI